jgi:hypothetical protein
MIGSSNEQLSYIQYDNFIFMDSAQHLKDSLDNLVSMTPKDKFHNFEYLKLDKVLLRKGVFPYEYVDSFDRLKENKLPPKECFKSTLRNTEITDEEYKYAQYIWDIMKCQTLKDYLLVYQLTDVVLLADVVENYRTSSIEAWGLDPLNFPSAPSLSWNSFMYNYKPKIETFSKADEEILKLVVNNMRGGISSRGELLYANVYASQTSRAKKKEYIAYLDMNNLYGKAMMMNLPTGNYQLVKMKEEEVHKLLNTYDFNNSTIGYILEVDIDPPENKEWFNGYPLFPEKIDGKLEATLYPKKNYLVHIAYLQLGIRLGYKLKNVHNVIKFTQDCILKHYIASNTEKRKQAPNKFFENFYKLLNNSIYGKTCENPMRYRNRKILTRKDDIIKFLNSPMAYDFHIINDQTILSETKKKTTYKKPIMIGFTVLELSKMIMADFYYNVMKKHYGSQCQLMYTDTDSLVCHIVSNHHPSEDFKTVLKDRFEQPETAKVPGLMKVEHFCYFFGAYAPKNYIFVDDKFKTNIKRKGIPKHALHIITYDDYKDKKTKQEFLDIVEDQFIKKIGTEEVYEYIKLGSKKHEISLDVILKKIHNVDTKRVIIDPQHANAKGL